MPSSLLFALVDPVGYKNSGPDNDWQRWAMFLLSTKGRQNQPADLSLVIPPAAQQVLEGQPLDDVLLVRDEMANMVWGVERAIALPSGEWKNGREADYETVHFTNAICSGAWALHRNLRPSLRARRSATT